MLVWLPAPTISIGTSRSPLPSGTAIFFHGCPDNAFQTESVGKSYSLSQRIGAILVSQWNPLPPCFKCYRLIFFLLYTEEWDQALPHRHFSIFGMRIWVFFFISSNWKFMSLVDWLIDYPDWYWIDRCFDLCKKSYRQRLCWSCRGSSYITK